MVLESGQRLVEKPYIVENAYIYYVYTKFYVLEYAFENNHSFLMKKFHLVENNGDWGNLLHYMSQNRLFLCLLRLNLLA